MAVVDTTTPFSNNEQITSTKLNNIMDNSFFVSNAVVTSGGLEITAGGQMQVASSGIVTTKIADLNVTTAKIADNAVTQAKANNMLLPAGAVMPFAMNSAPTGWLAANGSAVSRTTYADLFGAIGTTYGSGDGSTTFTLPDLRGYFVRGSGTNGDETESGAFGAKQADEIKSHTHVLYKHRGTTDGGNTNATRSDNGNGLGPVNTQATGGTETRPKNIAMLYCIKI
jgi:microcystin-dependent protein